MAQAVKPDFWPCEQQENQAVTETAALLLRVVGERATIALSNIADRDIFMDALTSGVFQALEDNGVMSDELQEFLIKRYDEYNEIRKWLPEKDEGAKDTLFWEFGKNVADTFRCWSGYFLSSSPLKHAAYEPCQVAVKPSFDAVKETPASRRFTLQEPNVLIVGASGVAGTGSGTRHQRVLTRALA